MVQKKSLTHLNINFTVGHKLLTYFNKNIFARKSYQGIFWPQIFWVKNFENNLGMSKKLTYEL